MSKKKKMVCVQLEIPFSYNEIRHAMAGLTQDRIKKLTKNRKK